MTEYNRHPVTMAEAQALVGKRADVSEWHDDERRAKITYPAARIAGIIERHGPYLVIETAGAVITSSRTGRRLGSRPPEPELRIALDWVCEISGVREEFGRGDRVALERTDDPDTRLRPGDEGTVAGYDPRLGQLAVRWDSGSTLSMLINDGDQVRLVAPAAEAGPGAAGTEPVR